MPASDWLSLCQQTIVWQPMTGRDNYGAPIWGAPQTFPGRRVFKNQRVAAYERGTKGQGPEVLSESQIWILATLNIGYEDACYISGDSIVVGGVLTPSPPPILGVQRYPDETGQDLFTKVLLGSSNG